MFTFGAGGAGQLGHNSTRNEFRPRMVAELWGARVSLVACGRWESTLIKCLPRSDSQMNHWRTVGREITKMLKSLYSSRSVLSVSCPSFTHSPPSCHNSCGSKTLRQSQAWGKGWKKHQEPLAFGISRNKGCTGFQRTEDYRKAEWEKSPFTSTDMGP